MKAPTIFFLSLFILLSSCRSYNSNPYYSTSHFKEIAKDHKSIAVLPFEVQTKNYLPEELPEEEIEEIEEFESKAFQVSFYNEVLTNTRIRRNEFPVNLQHYNTTLRKLKENDISITDSWTKSPEALAEILEVDAIVIGRIEKQRYFSDKLSIGIDILNRVGNNPFPYVSRNNKNIKADYSILDSEDGKVLWSINYSCEANWQQQSDQIIERINNRSVRHFPYRID